MRYVFDKDGIDPATPGILLLSHGGFAVGCLETIRMFFGDAPNLAAFSLEEGMEPEEFAEAAFDAYRARPRARSCWLTSRAARPTTRRSSSRAPTPTWRWSALPASTCRW